MERYPVNSSFAKNMGYDPSIAVLEFETQPSANAPGHIYQLKNVSPFTYAAWVTANSIGKYYNRYIKNRYECTEVWEQHDTADPEASISDLADVMLEKVFERGQKFLENLLK